jgi:hypothetical protein
MLASSFWISALSRLISFSFVLCFLAICEKFLFAVQLQLKVGEEGCVLFLGCGMGYNLVVAVVTSRMAKVT